jgi:hypothetical protein
MRQRSETARPRLAMNIKKTETHWPQTVSELYRASYRRLLAKLVPTFAERGCR